MPISFYTPAQHMIFEDGITHMVTEPSALLPGKTYNVFCVLQNTDKTGYNNVIVHVVHSPFGIGITNQESGIVQPPPVDVPPAWSSTEPGLATVEFKFTAPPGGHGCLLAKVQPNGPCLGQNLTVVAVPVGTWTLSFLVFAPPDPRLELILTEKLESGAIIPVGAANSWHPQFLAPAQAGVVPGPHPSPLNLTLNPALFYSVGIQVTIPNGATGAHIMHVEGYSPNKAAGTFVGEVDIKVAAATLPMPAPDPYIVGGYQSPDVVLIDLSTGLPVPLGGAPGGPWDTLLRPNTDYGIRAMVHNASMTPAVNTIVRFWEFPGGVGSAGTLIDVKSVTIGGNDTVPVTADKPFHSAPPDGHKCAVISIFNSLAPGMKDATSSAGVSDPNANYLHSHTAWRNTDSMHVFIGQPLKFTLALRGVHMPKPMEVVAEAVHFPHEFVLTPAMQEAIRKAGLPQGYPPYLVAEVRNQLKKADLQLKMEPARADVRVEVLERATGAVAVGVGGAEVKRTLPSHAFKVTATEPEAPITITGKVPDNAKVGDLFAVTVVAYYFKTEDSPERAVEFTNVLHVIKK